MAHRYFEGKVHAMLYAKYRTIPPQPLIDRVVSFLKEKYTGKLDLMIDVGCGSGQSTGFYAPYFHKVVGTDISASMIDKAKEQNLHPNVTFSVSPSEVIAAESGSVQLVTTCQAAHWFDLPKFYDEGKRVLCPNGVLALYGYQFPIYRSPTDDSLNTRLNLALNKFYLEDLKGYWAAERIFVDNRYENFVIPYSDFTRDETFYHDQETNVKDVMNYVLTWSGYQNFCKKNGEDEGAKILQNFENNMMEILNVSTPPKETIITKRTSFFLLMARNS